MSLPDGFETSQDYFEEAMEFFRQHQYLYNFVNTSVLSSNCLDNIAIEGLDDINVLYENITLQHIAARNRKIKGVFEKIQRLKYDYGQFVEREEIEGILAQCHGAMKVKKRHEVIHFVEEIKEICEATRCDTIVDFGSGLGYLDQLIFDRFKYNVLGLECNNDHYVGSKKRQREYHGDSIDKVKYIRHTITSKSDVPIGDYLRNKFREHRGFCIIGLHSCADLTIDAIDIFAKMPDANSMVMMSCCYHKMQYKCFENGDRFRNFPLSHCLKVIFEKNRGFEYLRVPFLRLAAQPPSSDELLKDLVFSLLTRAVIQLYADKYNYKLQRNRRKAVKFKGLGNDFESYVQQASDGFKLKCKNDPCPNRTDVKSEEKCKCDILFDLEDLRELWTQFCDDVTVKKAAIFILLQRAMQPVFENFVLYDRIIYLKEKGLDNCKIKKIFDETISPRCLALLACK